MTNKIKEIFNQFNQFNILIIGDVMIDAYMWGKVKRISPEAPVPIANINEYENRMGGAANVGLNIKALGANPIICAVIGNDDKGKTFKNLLQKRNMTDKGILTSDKRQTTVKTRIISNNQHLLRIDEETTKPLDQQLENEFINHINSLIENNNFNAIIFEDYDKGNITPKVIEFVVNKAKQLNIPTLVDPKKRNFTEYKGVTLFKPNFKEITEGLKVDIPKKDFDALNTTAQKLKEKLQAKHIMVTLSELGVFITDDNKYIRMPAEIRSIADVSGAGDTVISVAACCLAANTDIQLLATISNLAGGLVCEQVGVVPIDKETLMNEAIEVY